VNPSFIFVMICGIPQFGTTGWIIGSSAP